MNQNVFENEDIGVKNEDGGWGEDEELDLGDLDLDLPEAEAKKKEELIVEEEDPLAELDGADGWGDDDIDILWGDNTIYYILRW